MTRRKLWSALAVVGLAATVAVVHDGLLRRRAAFPKEQEVLYVPPAAQLGVMSVGYREALADLLWVQALVLTGASFGDTDVAVVTRYANAITGLSPRFHRAYRWGGVTPVYAGGPVITRDMVDRGIEIYRRGVAQFPESHELLYPLGMLLVHQVASTPGYTEQERASLRSEGIEFIRRAAAFGADPLVRSYAATLMTEHATDQLAIQFLESQLAQAESAEQRYRLGLKLQELAGSEAVEQVDEIRRAFTREQSSQAPYLPDALYAVIRSEHVGAASDDNLHTASDP